MKTDIGVKCSAKITKKKGISKSQSLSNFWVSDAWHALARFGKQTRRYMVKTLTFPEWRFFRGSDRIWQSRTFLLSLYQASTLNQPQKWGRTQENWCKEGQPDSDSQTSFFLIEIDVHVYIARLWTLQSRVHHLQTALPQAGVEVKPLNQTFNGRNFQQSRATACRQCLHT